MSTFVIYFITIRYIHYDVFLKKLHVFQDYTKLLFLYECYIIGFKSDANAYLLVCLLACF